jgi:transposase
VLWKPAGWSCNHLYDKDSDMNSSTILKQAVGIDVASQSLRACIGTISLEQQITHTSSADFANTPTGIAALLKWITKHRLNDLPISVLMEATGVYHERLAVALHEEGYTVVIVLPNKIKHFAQSLNLKSKTDAIDAEVILRYGLERQQTPWQPPMALLAELKAIVRQHNDIQTMLTEVRNRLHASQKAASTP